MFTPSFVWFHANDSLMHFTTRHNYLIDLNTGRQQVAVFIQRQYQRSPAPYINNTIPCQLLHCQRLNQLTSKQSPCLRRHPQSIPITRRLNGSTHHVTHAEKWEQTGTAWANAQRPLTSIISQ
jgi:hypothetical protein